MECLETLRDRCNGVTLGDRCNAVTLGDRWNAVTLGDRCNAVTLGGRCNAVTLRDRCNAVTVREVVPVHCTAPFHSSASVPGIVFTDHHLIFGAEEGIFTLNLSGPEATMELVRIS